MTYRCVPMDTAVADRFRQTGIDDAGDELHRMTVQRTPGGGAYPCRHCLDLIEDGTDALLGSFRLEKPLGIYWTPSPIFVHADGCNAFAAGNEIPWFIPERPVAVRAYDADDMMLYDLSDVAEGDEIEPLVKRCVGDERTSYANIHTARFGCFLCRVEAA